jgi:KaiC/GvpD/RAD55 family RecA-like ATPase
MDPVETENKEAIELKNKVSEKITEYSSELSIHDFRVVFGETHNNLIFDVLAPTNFKLTDEEIEIKMNELVKEINSKNNAVIRIDKKYHC